MGIAIVTGFPAKEIIVSTLGVLYRSGGYLGEGTESLRGSLRADPRFSPLVAFVFMLSVLVISPCFAALATLGAEFGKAWLSFTVGYMFALSWLVALVARQVGLLLGFG
jgi:ferrous iron transport protein B